MYVHTFRSCALQQIPVNGIFVQMFLASYIDFKIGVGETQTHRMFVDSTQPFRREPISHQIELDGDLVLSKVFHLVQSTTNSFNIVIAKLFVLVLLALDSGRDVIIARAADAVIDTIVGVSHIVVYCMCGF